MTPRNSFSLRPRALATAGLAAMAAASLAGIVSAGGTVEAASKQYAVYTSVQNIDAGTECPNGGGNGVNCNIYTNKNQVFLNGGPASDFLPDGEYCFSVYAPNGKNLLSTDQASNRAFSVSGGAIGYSGSHATGLDSREQPSTMTIGFMPYNDTPNPGGEYKFSLYKYESPVTHSGVECNEDYDIRKTDNFKVKAEDEQEDPTPPPGTPTDEETPPPSTETPTPPPPVTETPTPPPPTGTPTTPPSDVDEPTPPLPGQTPPPPTETPSPTQGPVQQPQEPGQPTPVDTVAGVSSTPIPPSTGTGIAGGEQSGPVSTLGMILGLVVSLSGLGALAATRKR